MNSDEVFALLKIVARQAIMIEKQNEMLVASEQQKKALAADKAAIQAELDALKKQAA
jgi:hypothetical protein